MQFEQVKKIGLYICNIIYRCGGTESYTVKIVQSLQHIFPKADIYFVSELYSESDSVSDRDFTAKINTLYGTSITPETVHIKFISCSDRNAVQRRIMYKKIQDSSGDFDLFFYCSRGNFVFKAKKNVTIIHFPVLKIEEQKKIAGSRYFKTYIRRKDKNYADKYDLFLPNSKYTESWLKRRWPEINDEKIKLIYPPIIPIEKTSDIKEKSILVCSRIERSKKIEVLVEAFKKSAYLAENYALWIVGGKDASDPSYGKELDALSSGYNIQYYTDVSHEELARFYNRASFFWHCKGYGTDEEKDPYKLEHFGVTTVEAMSAGCIPVVISKGGQKEIVTEGTGFTWNTPAELIRFTEETAENPQQMDILSHNAVFRSKDFSMENFTEQLGRLLQEI